MNQEPLIDKRPAQAERAIELDLREVVRKLREGWIAVALTVAAFWLLTLVVLVITKPTYTSTMTLVPSTANEQSQSMTSSLLSSFSSLTGANLGPANADVESFIVLTTSTVLAQRLIEENPDLLHIIFYKNWDAKHKRWVAPSGPIAWIKAGAKALIGYSQWHPPDAVQLANYLSRHLTVAQDAQTTLITMSMTSTNPAFAQKMLTLIHREADNQVRHMTKVRAEARVAYITKILPTVTVSEQRDALIALLSQSQQRVIVAGADKNFVADVVIPPDLPQKPTWPRPVFLAVLMTAIGVIVGLILVFVIDLQIGIGRFNESLKAFGKTIRHSRRAHS